MNVLSRYKKKNFIEEEIAIIDLGYEERDAFQIKHINKVICSLMVFLAFNIIALFFKGNVKIIITVVSLAIHLSYTYYRTVKYNIFMNNQRRCKKYEYKHRTKY